MKVLVLRSNPRATGQTQTVGDWFVEGLKTTEARITDINLTRKEIAGCKGCFHCWLAKPGHCSQRDDMGPLLDEALEADVLVCMTPVYHFSMSSAMKAFFERTFPLLAPRLVPSGRGFLRNSIREPGRWRGKKLITLVAGALRNPEMFRPINETFQLIADSLDLELGGQLTRPESYLLDFPLSKPRTLKRIRNAFFQAGVEAGRTGLLSDETVRAAAAPLAADEKHYVTYSNIYWELALEIGAEATKPGVLRERAGSDVRILMREMVRCHDAKATARVKATLEFEFTDQNLAYSVAIDHGTCALEEKRAQNPDLRVRCAASVWAGLFTRQVDAREALLKRQIQLQGDKLLFARLDRFFPPPLA